MQNSRRRTVLHILGFLATLMWKIITDCCCGRTYLHSVHRLYSLKWLKVPTSLHFFFSLFSSRSFKSPFTFTPYSHCGSLSLALSFFPFISIYSSLPPFLSSLSLSPSLSSSICLSRHSLSRGGRGRADGFPFLRPCCGFLAAVGLR